MTRKQFRAAIKDHAIIGDMHTVALIDTHGTIDFCCMPRIDGPSVFASLLDPKGGSFTVDFEDGERSFRQIYVPDTNVLITRVLSDTEIIEITDFMVIGQGINDPIIIRRVQAMRGTPTVTVRCAPAFHYAQAKHTTKHDKDGVRFEPKGADHALQLMADLPLIIERGGSARATFTLERGNSHCFVLGVPCKVLPRRSRDVPAFVDLHLQKTTNFWKGWSGRSTYRGRYREAVMRSALAMKLLVSADFGSIAAAATFGLPEASRGQRNWDYRYSWIRDASFTVYAFIRLGYTEEAVAFMQWMGRCLGARDDSSQPLQPMYRMDGSTHIPEIELKNFAGFEGSKPVRVGNAASGQLQLDIYGACMDAVYLTSKYGGALSVDAWQGVVRVIDWVCSNWKTPDEGIWEVRNGRNMLLHSRVMCWVAVDRATRLAVKRSLPASVPAWGAVRTEIYNSIISDFWNQDMQAFVRTPGGTELDASAMMLPLVRFISASDPRWQSTLAQLIEHLTEDGLVHRYRPSQKSDGMAGHEGAFTTCSFWLVECLARQGDVEQAHLIFEKIMDYGNHVGLFAEEIGPRGEHLGNFPQALTHLSLISAAVLLDRDLSGKTPEPWR